MRWIASVDSYDLISGAANALFRAITAMGG